MNSAFSGNTLKVIESMGASIKGLSDSVGTLTGRIKEMHKELGLTMPQMAQQAGFAQTQVSGAAAALGGGSGGGGPSSGGGPGMGIMAGGGIGALRSLLGAAGTAQLVNKVSSIIDQAPGAVITNRQNQQFGLMDAVRGDATNLMVAKYGENVPGQGLRTFKDFAMGVGKGVVGGAVAGSFLGGPIGSIAGGLVGGAIGAGQFMIDTPAREARQRQEQLAYNKMLTDILPQSRARMAAMSGPEQIFGAAYGNAAGRGMAGSAFSSLESFTGNTEYSVDLLKRFSGAGGVGNGKMFDAVGLQNQAEFERKYGTADLARTMMNVRGRATGQSDMNAVLSQMGGFENDFAGRDVVSQTVAGLAGASPLMYQDTGSIANQTGQVGQVLNFGKGQGFNSAAAQGAIAGQIPNVNQSIYGGGYVQMKMYAEMRRRGIPESAMGALVGRAMNKGRLDDEDFNFAEKASGTKITDRAGLMNIGQETMKGIFANEGEAQLMAESSKMGQADQAAFGAAYAGSVYGKKTASGTATAPGIKPQETGIFELEKSTAAGLTEITKTLQSSAEDFRRIIREGAQAAAKDIADSTATLRRNINAAGPGSAINGIKR